jgi:hypothetical protein
VSTRCPPDQSNNEDRDRATVIPRNDQTNVRSVKLGNHCPTNFRPSFTVMMRGIGEWQKRLLPCRGCSGPAWDSVKPKPESSSRLLAAQSSGHYRVDPQLSPVRHPPAANMTSSRLSRQRPYFSSAAGGLHEPSRRKFKCAIL